MSKVFDEKRAADTVAKGLTILGSGTTATDNLDRQLLAAWLTFSNGAVGLDQRVDTNGDAVADAKFWDVVKAAETVRASATATKAQVTTQAGILETVNKG